MSERFCRQYAAAVIFELEQRLINDEIYDNNGLLRLHLLWLEKIWHVRHLTTQDIKSTRRKKTEKLFAYLQHFGYLPADLTPIQITA